MMSLLLISGILLDLWLGEPKKYHPLVGFGHLAQKIETLFRHPKHTVLHQKIRGLFAVTVLVFPLPLLIYNLEQQSYALFPFISILTLYLCIATQSLKQHSVKVFDALEDQNIASARTQVSMIVSRETQKMNTNDIQKATIESVLENGADAIFAPIFWFIIAGPAGAIFYRLSNTLDAMWGYKNARFIHFGWAAARLDDTLNWLPARLTAITYALLGQTTQAFDCWKQHAHLLDSPNAGPVMTSGAGALNLQLGGAAWYHGKLKNKPLFGCNKTPTNNDILRANSLITQGLLLWVSIIAIIDIAGFFLA